MMLCHDPDHVRRFAPQANAGHLQGRAAEGFTVAACAVRLLPDE